MSKKLKNPVQTNLKDADHKKFLTKIISEGETEAFRIRKLILDWIKS